MPQSRRASRACLMAKFTPCSKSDKRVRRPERLLNLVPADQLTAVFRQQTEQLDRLALQSAQVAIRGQPITPRASNWLLEARFYPLNVSHIVSDSRTEGRRPSASSIIAA